MARTPTVNVVSIVKGEEAYIFLYGDDAASGQALMQVLARFATDPELSFSWYDAAVLSRSARSLQLDRERAHGDGDRDETPSS